MKFTAALSFAILLILSACKQKKAGDIGAAIIDSTDHSHMPVADFLKEDIRKVDSFAGGILLKTNLESRKDSQFVKPEQFHALSQLFLRPELDSAYFNANYTETSLMDESTEMLNFIYTPKKDSMGLKKLVLYVSPSLTIDQVNRVYMETFQLSGDTAISRKLTWKLRKYLIVAENKLTPGGYDQTTVRKLIWDPTLFAEE